MNVAHVDVFCSHCGNKFSRYRGRVNEAVKFGWKQYCSNKCQYEARLTGANYICQTCDKTIWRTPKETRTNKTKRFFCTTSCAAIYNNRIRSETIPKKFCKICNKQIPRSQIYCSYTCANYPRKRTIESLQKEVLSKIRKFYNLNKRIPVKKEMYDAYKKSRRAFGAWNKAVKAAGYEPNPVMFAKRYVARDGHQCDSFAEKIIDEWLYSKNIPHERSVPYPEEHRLTCDFVINKIFVEFFGLEGAVRNYDRLVALKRELSKKHKLKLIEIKPIHLFPKNKLDDILGSLVS